MGKKFIIALATLILSPVLMASYEVRDTANDVELFTYSNELIKPIREGEAKRLIGTIKYNGEDELANIKVIAKLYHHKNDTPYQYRQVTASLLYPVVNSGDVIVYDFDVSDSDTYAKYKILITLCVYREDEGRLLHWRDLYLYTKSNEVINPDEYRFSPLIYNHLTYQDGSKFTEEFLFEGIKNENSMLYYRLDPSIFSFNYSSSIPLTMGDCYISFIDKDNLYPHINERDGYKTLPLIFHEEDGLITFKFQTLYVNKDDLDMSSYLRDGYYRTNYLYFPRNKQTQIQGYTFYINLVNMGANGIAVHHEVMLKTSRPLLGPCNEAVYCVVGGKA